MAKQSHVEVCANEISRILAGKVERWTRLSEEICLYAEKIEGRGITQGFRTRTS